MARAHDLVQGVAAGQGTEASSLGTEWEVSEAVTHTERIVVERGTPRELVFDFAVTQLASAPAHTPGQWPVYNEQASTSCSPNLPDRGKKSLH